MTLQQGLGNGHQFGGDYNYCICSNIGATLIQAPFETCAIFSVLTRGAFADGNYFQAAPILIRTDIAMRDITDRY